MRNHLREEVPQNLTGSLLIAHPNMLDPNFRRSVLFISSHDPNEGAMGVILNRPLDKQVADLVGEAPPDGLADVPVFLGGPVGKNQLMFAAFEWEDANGLKLNHNVNVDEANDLVDEDPAGDSRVCRLCGLERGSARAEMKQKAWILQKPSRAALTPERLPSCGSRSCAGSGLGTSCSPRRLTIRR
jgi:putative transcriptional regulator